MTNRLTITALALLSLASAKAEIRGEWKTYPSFDSELVNIIATPGRAYFLGLAQKYSANSPDYSDRDAFLFAYDKEGDEVVSFTTDNYLSENIISKIQYHPQKHYLVIAYSNGNIDLLYDDNTVVNIDALKNTSLNTSKEITGISFDIPRNRIYMAGKFGYIVIDDENAKVVDSRVYDRPVFGIARVGDTLVVGLDDGMYRAPADAKLFSLSDFSKVSPFGSVTELMPLDDTHLAFVAGNDIYNGVFGANGYDHTRISGHANMGLMQYNRDGFYVGYRGAGVQISLDGKATEVPAVPEAEHYSQASTWDGKEIWSISPRKGLWSYTLDGSKYTATRSSLYPNAPASYRSHYGMAYSPKYGMLVGNHGVTQVFSTYTMKIPAQVSALKNGEWTNYGYPYTNTDYSGTLVDSNGMAIDPNNPDHVYYGSFFNGVQRNNLADPKDMLLLSHPADPSSSKPFYLKLDDDEASWPDLMCMAPPAFDKDGNLWMMRMAQSPRGFKLYFWDAQSVKNKDISKVKINHISTATIAKQLLVYPCRTSANKDILLASAGAYSTNLYIIDTKGTPGDFSDDSHVVLTNPVDQDGSSVNSNYIYALHEDENGTIWVGGASGVFTFNPRNSFKDPNRVNRIKVARDDGTNLADYLLDNIPVYSIAVDGQGRKWFATGFGGVVVTSPDGRTIEDEITAANSGLPDDNVYEIKYNPAENSMVVSTQHGIAEFRIAGAAAGSSDAKKVNVYPNPVRPDYLGWVTIEDLPSNAIVKITDAMGNLVKELGFAENGSIRWDVTNSEMKRVKSGVYHIFTSSADEGDSAAPVGKILVVN